MKNSGAFRAILTAGLVVGVLDISSALVIWWQRGVGARRGLQGIAAGLLGANAFDGGLVTAGLGLALHFFVAFVVVSIFYLASRKIEFLPKGVDKNDPFYPWYKGLEVLFFLELGFPLAVALWPWPSG